MFGIDEIDFADVDFSSGLRVLYLPVISSNRMIEASPSYNWFRTARKWVQNETDWNVFWSVVWPEYDHEDSRFDYTFANDEDEIEFHTLDNVELIRVPMHETQTTEMIMDTKDLRSRVNMAEGDVYYDVIWNEKPVITPGFMEQVKPRRERDSVMPPVVNTNQIVPWTSKSFSKYTQLRMAVGMAGPRTYTLFESPHQREWTMDVFREHFRSSVVEDIIDRTDIVSPGLDTSRLDDILDEDIEKDDPLSVIHAGKLYMDRRYEQSWKILDSLYASGADVDIKIVTPKMSAIAGTKPGEYSNNIDHFEVVTDLSKGEYLREAARSSIMVNSVKETDFNTTLAEVAYLGALPVVQRGRWSDWMYGEDYPLTYDSKSQAVKMLIHAYQNIDELRDEWVPRLRDRLREKFDASNYTKALCKMWWELRNDMWADDWYDLRAEQESRYATGRKEVVKSVLRQLPDQFTMREFADEYEDRSESNVNIIDSKGRSPMAHLRFYWILKREGIVDSCDGPEPELDKSDVDHTRWR